MKEHTIDSFKKLKNCVKKLSIIIVISRPFQTNNRKFHTLIVFYIRECLALNSKVQYSYRLVHEFCDVPHFHTVGIYFACSLTFLKTLE